jgi:putative ABC transport system permease protein
MTLSMAGGAAGVTIGMLAARFLASRLHWPFSTRLDVVVISFVFSAAVGVGFGLYPARKASQLDPIDALRYE